MVLPRYLQPLLVFSLLLSFHTKLWGKGLPPAGGGNCLAPFLSPDPPLTLPVCSHTWHPSLPSCAQQHKLPQQSKSFAPSPGLQLREAKSPFTFQILSTVPLQLAWDLHLEEGRTALRVHVVLCEAVRDGAVRAAWFVWCAPKQDKLHLHRS